MLVLWLTCSYCRVQKDKDDSPSERQIEHQIHDLVNDYRRSRGLRALEIDAALQKEAQQHSLDMARRRIPLSHQGFQERIARAREENGAKGRAGENVADGWKSAREAVDAWIKSRGHRRHMLGDFDLTGIGVARDRNGKLYFTQLFMARKYEGK